MSYLNIHFLSFQKCCQCDVINPRNANLTQVCESAWVTSNMGKSDCIAFVNFKGMDTLVEAFLDGQATPLDPNHSLLHNALQFAFNSKNLDFISVTFPQDWIQDKLAYLKPKKFVLPKELTSFLAGVHHVRERSAENYMVCSYEFLCYGFYI